MQKTEAHLNHMHPRSNMNESIVSFVSRRYMRVVNGSLVVCLSEYLPLHSVYILVITV